MKYRDTIEIRERDSVDFTSYRQRIEQAEELCQAYGEVVGKVETGHAVGLVYTEIEFVIERGDGWDLYEAVDGLFAELAGVVSGHQAARKAKVTS